MSKRKYGVVAVVAVVVAISAVLVSVRNGHSRAESLGSNTPVVGYSAQRVGDSLPRARNSRALNPIHQGIAAQIELKMRELRGERTRLRELDDFVERALAQARSPDAAIGPERLRAIQKRAAKYREGLERIERELLDINGGAQNLGNVFMAELERKQLRKDFLSSLRGREVLWLASQRFLDTSPRRESFSPSLVAWRANKRRAERAPQGNDSSERDSEYDNR